MKTKYQYIGILPKTIRIKENDFWGVNDHDGNEILPSTFIEVFTLSSGYGLIAARESGLWGIYDFYGNLVNSEKYDFIYPFYGMFGMSKVKTGNKWGLLNRYGHKIIPLKYREIKKFGKGLALYGFDNSVEFIPKYDLVNLPEIHPILGIKSSIELDKKFIPKKKSERTRTL